MKEKHEKEERHEREHGHKEHAYTREGEVKRKQMGMRAEKGEKSMGCLDDYTKPIGKERKYMI